MDVSTPPSLDLAYPQAKTKIEKHVHMLRERGVDKNKIPLLQDGPNAIRDPSTKLCAMP